MNTRYLFLFIFIYFSFLACKKEKRNEPPAVISYNIKTIIGSSTFLKYSYNEQGYLSHLEGKDRDKSISCDIIYDKDRVYLDYFNKTANEKWWVILEIDSVSGYIQKYDDGMYVATFLYDSLGFNDGQNRVVSSFYHGGKYKGDSLCYQISYNPNGTLKSCNFRGEVRAYDYYYDQEFSSNVITFYSDAVLGRFDRIITYLPYTFGPPQKFLPKSMVRSNAFYTNFKYDKDEYGRVKTIFENGAGTSYEYMEE
ncbi:MAG: hypothetical protein LC105_00310 [Chitinophagales bacterium]|nr:hypothetical protein [Chitinophagales bacterium]MCZ2392287.1 hypothetical protein [Chitinophagales bacterium]